MKRRLLAAILIGTSALSATAQTTAAPKQLTRGEMLSNYYRQFRACASRAAIQYGELKHGDFTIYSEAIIQACSTKEMFDNLPLGEPGEAQVMAELSGVLNACATMQALRNLNTMRAPQLENAVEMCSPFVERLGMKFE